MILKYAPKQVDGAPEPGEWRIDFDEMPSDDAERIEEVTDLTWLEFVRDVQKGLTKARRALLWVLLRRTNPSLKYADVSFLAGEVTLDYDRDELEMIREQAEEMPPSKDRTANLLRLARAIEAASPAPGKAPSGNDGESGTGDSSEPESAPSNSGTSPSGNSSRRSRT